MLDRLMAASARHIAGLEIVLLGVLLVGGRGAAGRRRRGAAVRTGVALATTVLLVDVAGAAVGRQRPFAVRPSVDALLDHSPHRSFPSRHAACAAAMATVAWSAAPRVGGTMAALGGLLAVSRVYAGLHYPIDVLAGSSIGCAVGLLARRLRL